jgi:hypothetical protein
LLSFGIPILLSFGIYFHVLVHMLYPEKSGNPDLDV